MMTSVAKESAVTEFGAENLTAAEASRRSRRLENLGLVASGIAHDFSNMLCVALNYLSLAGDALEETAVAADLMAKAREALHQAAGLTRQVLAYSGKGRMQIQPVDFNETVVKIAGLLEVRLPGTIQVEFDLEPDLAKILADPVQIDQVVMNLVTNAADAIGAEEGRILIRTASASFSGEPAVRDFQGRTLAAGHYVVLEVSDSGCGMSEKLLARIFEPFFSTKPHGHGVGLSAIPRIVDSHGGGLWIETDPGRGSTFRLGFPSGQPCHGASHVSE